VGVAHGPGFFGALHPDAKVRRSNRSGGRPGFNWENQSGGGGSTMKLTILTRFGDQGASSRMRAFQYLPILRDAGIDVRLIPLFENSDLGRRYERGSYGFRRLIQRYFSRYRIVRSDPSELLWIEKELLPWIPASFEKWMIGGRSYIMDFDDAVFHNYDQHRIALVRKGLGKKIDALMKNAHVVMAGNEYLAGRARSAGCQRVDIIPTVIDLKKYPSPNSDSSNDQRNKKVVIGWIGSPYTTRYLELLRQPLQRLAKSRDIQFRVIGGRPVSFPHVDVKMLNWEESKEAEMLREFDVGVMPLPDTPFERGKCGYKLIQYMACGKPVIGSPVGVNNKIVTSGKGFLCETENEWYEAMLRLVDNPQLRTTLGRAGRKTVEDEYCLQKVGPGIVSILMSLSGNSFGNPLSDIEAYSTCESKNADPMINSK
jgi:glycosyltransferase involved in cell wall biosynthesis